MTLLYKKTSVISKLSVCASMLLSVSVFAQKTQSNNTNEIKQSENFKIQKNTRFNTENTAFKNEKFSFKNSNDYLFARAVLPAASFSEGPTSGQYINQLEVNGVNLPFINKQPIQGVSSILYNKNGTFTALSDNGFGTIENSADYNLRLYIIKPSFKYAKYLGKGNIEVIKHIQLTDPKCLIDFPIVNNFEKPRVLTGADFDIESIQRDANGDFWIGDEFGPFLLHFNKDGELVDPPYRLPDLNEKGNDLRSPQNPYNEEIAALRVMNAMRANAFKNGGKTPIMSPWFVMLNDGKATTNVASRENPPADLAKANSEIFNIQSLNIAGHPIVAYTVNDLENMTNLMDLNIQGIISDEPDLLLEAVSKFDRNNDGTPDYLDADGLIDVTKFDAQGHRGARNLRPENTLPSMEAALDYLMPTLETDCGITKDGYAILDHDPHIEAAKARKADGTTYNYNDEVLVKDHTLQEIQTLFIADKILPNRPKQTNNLELSPVAVAYAKQAKLIDPYVMPSLQQLFDFVNFYVNYYKTGEGATHPEAFKRWKNASRVRFNIETKINPRTDKDDRGIVFANRTVDAVTFTNTIAQTIIANGLENRCDIQSFDFRTLLHTQNNYPNIRTVCLFGDFPKVGNKGDGTNLQDQNGENTPWLAGLKWPYRVTTYSNPFKVKQSGGFEGMAITPNQEKLITLLEKPLSGSKNKTLLMNEFDIENKYYTEHYLNYPMNEKATAIGDFVLFGEKRGLVIERDGSQGNLNGFKAIYEVELSDKKGENVKKKHQVDLLKIVDSRKLSLPAENGDVGVGKDFAFPFVTIESVIVFNPFLIGVVNDNNYPFSIGRHVGTGAPDDTEFILVWLNEPLGGCFPNDTIDDDNYNLSQQFKAYPNTFYNKVTFTQNAKNYNTLTINIYSVTGSLVKTITHVNEKEEPFNYTWDAKTEAGNNLEKGIYFAVIEMDGTIIKKKLVKN